MANSGQTKVRIDRNKVQQLAAQGQTSTQIGKAQQKSPRSVQRALNKLGMSRPAGRPKASLDEEWEAVYVKVKGCPKTMTVAQAARHLGCSERTVQRRLKQMEHDNRIKRQTGRSKG